MPIPDEIPPEDFTQDQIEYLQRMFRYAKKEDEEQDLVPKRDKLPIVPEIGRLYYFNSAILPNITAEGYWGYKSTGWVQIG